MTSARATRARRWLTVAVALSALLWLPWTVGHLPRPGNKLSAGELLTRIQHSTGVSFSGYAESVGALALPVTSQVNGLDNLLGGRTSMRVWWRADRDWRVDQISAFGETDVHRDAYGTWTWNYESNRVGRTSEILEPAARIPVASDMLPPELGRRLLSEAHPDEVHRLPVRRIAGVDAPGLRLSTGPQSSIDHVDVFAQAGSGLPVQVDVYGRDDLARPTVTTSFLDLDLSMPAARVTKFAIPDSGASFIPGGGLDLVSAANQFSDARPPLVLAGLQHNELNGDINAVGVYGRGVTELVAIPLQRDTADRFSEQLLAAGAPVSTACSQQKLCGGRGGSRQEATVGPLSMLLLQPRRNQDWALTGTVSPATLRLAADELLADQSRGTDQSR